MTTTSPITQSSTGRLPILALIGLFISGFIGILTEALPAGLIPAMSKTLHQSVAVTGQTVTVYAIGTAIAVIPLAVATTNWRRRDLLIVALLTQIVTNGLTALSTDLTVTLIARFVASLSSAVIWALLGAYAARIAPAGKQGRAIAIALGGIPVALALGVPVGVLIGQVATWQLAFWGSAAMTALTIVWVLIFLPNLPGIPRTDRHTVRHVLSLKGVPTILFVVAAFVIAHNILYTYIAAYLSDIGLAAQTGWILFVFGALAVLSIFVVGTHIDRRLRTLIVVSTVLFAAAVLALALLSDSPVVVFLAAAAWGLAFGSSATLFTTAIVNASGPAGDVSQSVFISVFSGSIAGGGLIGGLLLGAYGTNILVDVCLVLAAAAAIVTIVAKRHAFPRS
ncbi:MFS transporter [Plantibacter sp. Mn2098]|uniref:MFS transporter n=1 Tax=Plantibacter sp. Mn2098 TaxID=3395266 RepID=UPI003BD6BEED